MGIFRYSPDRLAALVAAFLVLLAVAGGHFLSALPVTDGNLVYPIDDTYIHMAMAKNLVRHGVWGVTPHEFSSASSSIAYPLILAGVYRLFGVNVLAPLLINLVFGLVVVFLAEAVMARERVRRAALAVSLPAFVVLTPLPAMVLLGMEHTLQIAVAVAFVYVVTRQTVGGGGGEESRGVRAALLYALAPAVTLVRYEGMFLAFVACLLLLARKRIYRAISVAALAALPVVAFGLFSITRGDLFFPNSLLMKGKLPALTLRGILSYLASVRKEAMEAPHLLVLLACLVAAAAWSAVHRKRFWSFEVVFATMVVAATIVHLVCADTGWYCRYEAYLVALGILGLAFLWRALAEAARASGRPLALRVPGLLVLVLAAASLLPRAWEVVVVGPLSTKNIYEQAYQVGRFVRSYYNGEGVVAHDVGALSYYSEPRLVDLFGLGSSEFVRIRRSGESWIDTVNGLVEEKQARIAILYEDWWGPLIPRYWVKVGEWRLQDECMTCGNDTIAFYAIAEEERERLPRRLRQHRDRLPPDVLTVLAPH